MTTYKELVLRQKRHPSGLGIVRKRPALRENGYRNKGICSTFLRSNYRVAFPVRPFRAIAELEPLFLQPVLCSVQPETTSLYLTRSAQQRAAFREIGGHVNNTGARSGCCTIVHLSFMISLYLRWLWYRATRMLPTSDFTADRDLLVVSS